MDNVIHKTASLQLHPFSNYVTSYLFIVKCLLQCFNSKTREQFIFAANNNVIMNQAFSQADKTTTPAIVSWLLITISSQLLTRNLKLNHFAHHSITGLSKPPQNEGERQKSHCIRFKSDCASLNYTGWQHTLNYF